MATEETISISVKLVWRWMEADGRRCITCEEQAFGSMLVGFVGLEWMGKMSWDDMGFAFCYACGTEIQKEHDRTI